MEKICNFPGCEKEVQSAGLCSGHYKQKWSGKELTPLYSTISNRGRKKIWDGQLCEVKSCQREASVTGLCASCYARLYKFEITREKLIELPGECQVCGSSDRTHLDHNHESNIVRGVLCHGCNIALGMLKENKETMKSLIKYIEKHS
jgi:hypothetical protein